MVVAVYALTPHAQKIVPFRRKANPQAMAATLIKRLRQFAYRTNVYWTVLNDPDMPAASIEPVCTDLVNNYVAYLIGHIDTAHTNVLGEPLYMEVYAVFPGGAQDGELHARLVAGPPRSNQTEASRGVLQLSSANHELRQVVNALLPE